MKKLITRTYFNIDGSHFNLFKNFMPIIMLIKQIFMLIDL